MNAVLESFAEKSYHEAQLAINAKIEELLLKDISPIGYTIVTISNPYFSYGEKFIRVELLSPEQIKNFGVFRLVSKGEGFTQQVLTAPTTPLSFFDCFSALQKCYTADKAFLLARKMCELIKPNEPETTQ